MMTRHSNRIPSQHEVIQNDIRETGYFLRSLLETPDQGPLTRGEFGQLANFILLTAQEGTVNQVQGLYSMLVETRAALSIMPQQDLYQSFSELTYFFKQRRPQETQQVDDAYLSSANRMSHAGA